MESALSELGSEFKPYIIEGNLIHGGRQIVIKFDNGYGASIVRHSFSYGTELAVLKFDSTGGRDLCYETPITDDVIGYLTNESLITTLREIQALPPHS